MSMISPEELCPCESGKLYKDCHFSHIKIKTPPTITEEIRLNLVPEPDPNSSSKAVFVFKGEGTVVFQGFFTNTALCCGQCGSHLVAGMGLDTVQNIIFRCNNCGSFNET